MGVKRFFARDYNEASMEKFGNARFARTLFEQSLNAQALRLADEGAVVEELTDDDLMRLDPEDIQVGAMAIGENPLPPRATWWGGKKR